ncbi:AI-2E family transporter [Krasilnikovia sp. MM14-A1004]|uniref:AI-2E family transporter n=1 Tax=Krasilnikovia sp. MM14-A1004 TaxID=3373541 RepID=UPI00399C6380
MTGDDRPSVLSPGLVFTRAATATAGVLAVLSVAYGVYLVRGIIVLVLIGLFVAVSLDPAVRWMTARGLRRPWAVAILVVAGLVLLAGFVWSLVPPITRQGSALVTELPGYLRRLSDQSQTVREITDRYHLTARLTGLASALPGKLTGGAVGFLHRFLGALTSTVTVLVLAVYFMADLTRLRRGLVRVVPSARRPRVAHTVDVITDKVGAYMIGNLLISLIAGVATFACLELLRVPYAAPLAVTVALTDLIPMIGATLGAAICVLVALGTSGVWPQAVIVLLFFIAYQQLENYFIAPRVLRDSVSLSAVTVLLVALAGGTLLGLVGAVMAIPLAATAKVLLSEALPDAEREPSEPA